MKTKFLGRSIREWISSLPIAVLLISVIFLSLAENFNAQLNKLGNYLWEDYHLLRLDVSVPDCDPNLDISQELQRIVAEKRRESEDDPFGGMFADEPINEEAIRESIGKSLALCQQKHAAVQEVFANKTENVERFVKVDHLFSIFSQIRRDQQQMLLALVLFICAFTTTLTFHHIGLRSIHTRLDFQVSTAAQIIANSLLTYSSYHYLTNGWDSNTLVQNEPIRWAYVIGFSGLTVVTILQFFLAKNKFEAGGSIGKALLAIPLYCYMTLSASNHFLLAVDNPQGVALFVDKIMDTSSLFLQVGLYIWLGMLLKQTFIGEYVFRIFKPWRLPPELLAFVAVIVMAAPTAYTGASGIIILAMGAVIYTELRRVGARRQLALAATAMSGSLGVVLRPCLLVVLIAVLNKEVTTDMMYEWGIKVFMMTSLLFFLISLISRQGSLKVAPINEALGPSLAAIKPLIPYVVIFAMTAFTYKMLLDAHLDEHNAPYVLPVILLVLLSYEHFIASPSAETNVEDFQDDEREGTMEGAVRTATTHTSVHIGALLMLMSLGMAVGGMIEDTGIFEEVSSRSDYFDSQWTAIAALVCVLVLIGMIMDAFGAIVLVSGTVAQAAYQQGIDPLHFWMITLVAFELGFLSPPVAVNHLLTRQVVGDREVDLAVEESRGKGIWLRYERYLLPLTVMFISLMVVAFGPLVYQALG